MKKILFVIAFAAFIHNVNGQRTKIMSFPITDYIIDAGDSVMVVQIKLPQGLSVKEKNYCLIKSLFNNEGDSVITVGNGRCQLIKGEYYYFGLHKKNLVRNPVVGELLYVDVIAPDVYEGVLFDAIKHSIVLNSVYDTPLVNLQTLLQIKNTEDEKPFIAKLAADVKLTGAEMIKLGTVANTTITKGKFSGQKILNAMQTVTTEDVKDFLRYIYAHPEKYAGHTWKISETMATWMVGGTPGIK